MRDTGDGTTPQSVPVPAPVFTPGAPTGGGAQPITIKKVTQKAPAKAPAKSSAKAPVRSSGGGGGGGGGGSAAAAMSPSDAAGRFGYSLAFFDSDPELKSLLNKAIAQNFTADRFVAELRNTNWFQRTSESQRKYLALQTGDPATLASMRDQARAKVDLMASQIGGDGGALNADDVLRMGWDDNQIKRFLATHLKIVDGLYQGQAGALQSQFKQMVNDYAVDVSDDTMGAWVRGGVLGEQTTDTVKQQLINQAASKYVPFADRLKSGETMTQIADPYVQSMGKLLELNPEQIGVRDNTIQSALVTRDKDGQFVAKTLTEFEDQLRHDARWAKTDNAQNAMSATANKVLESFGLTAL